MASIPNHKLPEMITSICNGEDRISSLPDSMIVHILSFLPTKYAFRTSILSSRWKHLWSTVPNLDFDDETDELLYCSNITGNDAYKLRFMSFIDRVLLLHKLPHIHRFYVASSGEIDMCRVNTWITVAISRRVQELHIHICTEQPLHLPSELFTCKTLVVLKLFYDVEFKIPNSISFPSLKILHLSLYSPGNELTEKLFSCCPVLEELSIQSSCINSSGRTFNLHTPALKSLAMDLEAQNADESIVVVYAPNLEKISLKHNYLLSYLMTNVSSLVKADVNVGCRFADRHQHQQRVLTLLRGIYNVKYLTLGAGAMTALKFASDSSDLRLFHNLTHLVVGVNHRFAWQLLPQLLNSMPNLVNLVIKQRIWIKRVPLWVEPQGVPACLLLHLKEVRVPAFRGEDCDMEIIRYFLENSKVLVNLTIATCRLDNEKEFFKKLATFRRGLSTCQVNFY